MALRVAALDDHVDLGQETKRKCECCVSRSRFYTKLQKIELGEKGLLD